MDIMIMVTMLFVLAATVYMGLIRNFWVYRMQSRMTNYVHRTNLERLNSGNYNTVDMLRRYDEDYVSYNGMMWRFWDWNRDIEHWRRR